jgi:hypothetical protein
MFSCFLKTSLWTPSETKAAMYDSSIQLEVRKLERIIKILGIPSPVCKGHIRWQATALLARPAYPFSPMPQRTCLKID